MFQREEETTKPKILPNTRTKREGKTALSKPRGKSENEETYKETPSKEKTGSGDDIMKENRTCVICKDEFRTKSTSNRKTCGGKCAITYHDRPEQAEKNRKRMREFYRQPEANTKHKKYQKEKYYKKKLEMSLEIK